MKMILRIMKNNFLFSIGIIVCTLWIVMAIVAPLITPYSYLGQDLVSRFQAPSSAH